MNEFLLIKEVNKRPELWDTNCIQFRNKSLKLKGWQSLATQLGHKVESCTSTWKKLRDRYTRNKRLNPAVPEGGRRTWDKEELMKFLDKIIVSRRGLSNASEGSLTMDSQINVTEPTIKEEHISEDLVDPLIVKVECDRLSDEPLSPVSIDESVTSLPPMASTSSTPTRAQTPSKAKRKHDDNDEPNDELSVSLVNAINKLVDSEDKADNAEDCVIASFLKYHTVQVKQLLQGKNSTQQRRIRKRLSAFVDELYEDFE